MLIQSELQINRIRCYQSLDTDPAGEPLSGVQETRRSPGLKHPPRWLSRFKRGEPLARRIRCNKRPARQRGLQDDLGGSAGSTAGSFRGLKSDSLDLSPSSSSVHLSRLLQPLSPSPHVRFTSRFPRPYSASLFVHCRLYPAPPLFLPRFLSLSSSYSLLLLFPLHSARLFILLPRPISFSLPPYSSPPRLTLSLSLPLFDSAFVCSMLSVNANLCLVWWSGGFVAMTTNPGNPATLSHPLPYLPFLSPRPPRPLPRSTQILFWQPLSADQHQHECSLPLHVFPLDGVRSRDVSVFPRGSALYVRSRARMPLRSTGWGGGRGGYVNARTTLLVVSALVLVAPGVYACTSASPCVCFCIRVCGQLCRLPPGSSTSTSCSQAAAPPSPKSGEGGRCTQPAPRRVECACSRNDTGVSTPGGMEISSRLSLQSPWRFFGRRSKGG